MIKPDTELPIELYESLFDISIQSGIDQSLVAALNKKPYKQRILNETIKNPDFDVLN